MEKIFIGCDHAGLDMKHVIMDDLKSKDFICEDIGTFSSDAMDYPNVAHDMCGRMKNDTNTIGILICGTGIGMSIAANRYDYIRAALCQNVFEAEKTRLHNDANILCLGARVISNESAVDCVNTFLTTQFSNDAKHQRRIDMLRL